MATDTPYDRADLYDLIAPPDPAMEQFYVGQALERGRHVLELACGTGRFTIPMALAGAEVVGGDLSPSMLAAARSAADARGAAVDFCALDMRSFDLGERRFDTIVVAANSILHLHADDEFEGFFRSVRQHLAPGGRLVFDAFVPSVAILSRGPSERHVMTSAIHGTLGEVTVEETVRYDPITQVSQIDWYWSSAAQHDFWHTPIALRQIFPAELPLLLASGGFRLVERYGDFERNPLTPDRWRQVCIAERT